MAKKSINYLLGSFQASHVLDRYQAACDLMDMGEKSWPPLLEAVESPDRDISDFALATLVWTADVNLIPLILDRLEQLDPRLVLLHRLYRVLVGYGSLSVPPVVDRLSQGRPHLHLVGAMEEITGGARPPLSDENFKVAREFQNFLRDLFCLIYAPQEKYHRKCFRRWKKWYDKNRPQLPAEVDLNKLDHFVSLSPAQIREIGEEWDQWWKKNQGEVERYWNETYIEAVMVNILSDWEGSDRGEVEWSSVRDVEAYLEDIDASPFDRIRGAESYGRERASGDMANQSKPSLKKDEGQNLQRQRERWLACWDDFRRQQAGETRTFRDEMYQVLWYLETEHPREGVEILNALAHEQVREAKPGPLPKVRKQLLQKALGRVEQFTFLMGLVSDFNNAMGKLIFGLLLELLGRRKEARSHLEGEMRLEGPAADWWFTVSFYKEQGLARLHFKRRRFHTALGHLDRALEIGHNILLLRQAHLPDDLPHPLQLAAQKISSGTTLPAMGRELPTLHAFRRRLLETWKRTR